MSLTEINGLDLIRAIKSGCIKLEHNKDKVDSLNVFPVPDGDTGTNMYLTLLSAVKEGEKSKQEPLHKVIKSVSMGALMGARGNSGVILSQVFRGIAKVMEGKKKARGKDLAMAFRSGSNTAYEAVMKPVEGTILTVVREIARACEAETEKSDDLIGMLMAGVREGYKVLAKTPNMLPILKEAGVVDAGGQGFLFFLEGFTEGLAHDLDIQLEPYQEQILSLPEKESFKEDLQLEFHYCTEVLINGKDLSEEDIRAHLFPLGDSLLVAGFEEIIKVHIHTNHPGKVLESCLQWGQLNDIKIDNLLEETHEHLNNWNGAGKTLPAIPQRIGLVAVAAGDGIKEMLTNLGVDIVVEGGQTMNPSTEDLLNACNELDVESVIIFPNNSNIIMTAQQVCHLCERRVEVVPTKSIMQAITALIAFDPEGDPNETAAMMSEEIKNVIYGEITQAIRDSALNGLKIKNGDYIGIVKGNITVAQDNLEQAALELLRHMISPDRELITLLYGSDVTADAAEKLRSQVAEIYPCEIEVHYGGQPNYYYYLAVE